MNSTLTPQLSRAYYQASLLYTRWQSASSVVQKAQISLEFLEILQLFKDIQHANFEPLYWGEVPSLDYLALPFFLLEEQCACFLNTLQQGSL